MLYGRDLGMIVMDLFLQEVFLDLRFFFFL